MTHEDAGHYAAKHPNASIDADIKDAIEKKDKNGKVTCAAAHGIAENLNYTPGQVGVNLDLLEKRISKCQLGLFGYGAGKTKAVKPAASVSPELEKQIKSALSQGKISCKSAWDIAQKLNVGKMDVSFAIEALNIRVSHCQLGAF